MPFLVPKFDWKKPKSLTKGSLKCSCISNGEVSSLPMPLLRVTTWLYSVLRMFSKNYRLFLAKCCFELQTASLSLLLLMLPLVTFSVAWIVRQKTEATLLLFLPAASER